MLKKHLLIIAFTATIGFSNTSLTAATSPIGQTGDHFVVFTTKNKFNRSTTLDEHSEADSAVQDAADAFPALIGSSVGNNSWTAIVSTTGTGNGAKAYIESVFGSDKGSVDVYNMNGDLMVPFSSLWDGTTSAPGFRYDEEGNEITVADDRLVWTGTLTSGLVDATAPFQATGNTAIGDSWNTGSAWINNGFDEDPDGSTDSGRAFYAIHFFEALVPEPSTYLMLGSSLLLVGYARSKKKKVAKVTS